MLSIIVLLFLSPVYIVVTLILMYLNEGKAFFVQKRVGRHNRVFALIKFKSMNDKRDKEGLLLKDLERLTPFGKFIRKTSLDELPQIFNVLKGDMGIVGPRPLLPEYLPYYSKYHIRRHEIRPGVTGLAQTEGRNNLKFSERFNLDVQYVDSVSPGLDLKILFKTLLKVIRPSKDIQLGRPMSEVDDIGITVGLSKNYFNEKKEGENSK